MHPRGWKGRTEARSGGRNDWDFFAARGWDASHRFVGAPAQTLLAICSSSTPFVLPRANVALRKWCVCVCAGSHACDLCGFCISSRESPPPGTLGHRPHIITPLRSPRQHRRPPATSLILALMRTPWRGRELEAQTGPQLRT